MSFEKVLPERQHHPVINGTTESHYTEGTKVSVATSGKLLLKVVDGTFLLAIAWIGLREMYVSAGLRARLLHVSLTVEYWDTSTYQALDAVDEIKCDDVEIEPPAAAGLGTQLIPDSQSFVALGPVKLTTIPQLSTSTHGHVTSYWSFLSIMIDTMAVYACCRLMKERQRSCLCRLSPKPSAACWL
ncbi:hypothetical protein WJX82_005217 [Trebouxia sp. C0006]